MSKSNDSRLEEIESDVDSHEETLHQISHDHFMNIVNTNYGRYIKKAYGYLKCKSLAEDAVQDGILSAYKKLNTVRNIDALNGCINRIISNKALDVLRKNKRMPDFYGTIDDIITYNGGL